ncbi:MAG: peptidoglycan editing factor PgeF [Gammaproteobacteria bacterium]|nr:peptidoglycan editing factor PgeF [Gammaproteobacteria bacterium]
MPTDPAAAALPATATTPATATIPVVVEPSWPVPAHVRAATTTRLGGASSGACAALNMGYGGGDQAANVDKNRARVAAYLQLPSAPCWLRQVHGTLCVRAEDSSVNTRADASFTRQPGTVCVVITADCLPVLLAAEDGSAVAAAHAGWRGLSAGVLEATVSALQTPPERLAAWLGPAISGAVYEVDVPVREAFLNAHPADENGFVVNRPNHWLADLYALARARLERLGVRSVSGGEYCTYSDTARFYSYRRDGASGHMASFIWIERGENTA